MSVNQNNSQEETDLNKVFQKATDKLQQEEQGSVQKKTFKLSDKQKAAAVFGTVLLGGSAFVAVDQVNGNPVEPEASHSPTFDTSSVKVDSETVSQPLKVGETQTVSGGSICPTEEIQIAGNVHESMSFSDAFSSAREEVGPGGIFTWHGNTYNTFYKEEWNQIGLADKQEFLHDIGFRVEIPEKHDTNLVNSEPDQETTSEAGTDLSEFGDVKETYINGRLTYAFDTDNDGIADAIVMTDEDSNQTVVMLDESGDNGLDTIVVMDATTLEPISSEPLDETVEISMASIDENNLDYENEDFPETEMSVDTTTVDVSLEDESMDEDVSLSEDYSHDDNVDDINEAS